MFVLGFFVCRLKFKAPFQGCVWGARGFRSPGVGTLRKHVESRKYLPEVAEWLTKLS